MFKSNPSTSLDCVFTMPSHMPMHIDVYGILAYTGDTILIAKSVDVTKIRECDYDDVARKVVKLLKYKII